MIPNDAYFQLFEKDKLPEPPMKADNISVGVYAAIQKLAESSGKEAKQISDVLKKVKSLIDSTFGKTIAVKEDIENINLPDISKEKKMTIYKLLNNINERSAIYSNILDNDDKIVRYAINSVIGGNDD